VLMNRVFWKRPDESLSVIESGRDGKPQTGPVPGKGIFLQFPGFGVSDLCRASGLEEVAEQLHPGSLTFLRVKLSGHHVASSHSGKKRSAIVCRGGHPRGRFSDTVITVHKVKPRLSRQPLQQRRHRLLRKLQLIPAHVGYLEFRGQLESTDGSRNDPKSRVFAVFERAIKEQLQAKADSKERAIGSNMVPNDRGEVMTVNGLDGIPKCPDTRQNHTLCRRHLVWIRADDGSFTNAFKGLLHTAKVAHAIVNNQR
jgi:hypothetical protein